MVWERGTPEVSPESELSPEVSPSEARCESRSGDAGDTGDTFRTHTRARDDSVFPNQGPRGPQGPPNGHDRERIGSCAYCFDAAYADDAMALESGGVLHRRCADLWSRS
jgi:hypothetical protein